MGQARQLCRAELPGRMTGCRQGGPRLASVSNDEQKILLGNQALALQSKSTEVNFKACFVINLDRIQLPLARSLGEYVPPRG